MTRFRMFFELLVHVSRFNTGLVSKPSEYPCCLSDGSDQKNLLHRCWLRGRADVQRHRQHVSRGYSDGGRRERDPNQSLELGHAAHL